MSDSSKETDKLPFDISRFDRDREVQKMVFETRFSEIARRFGDVVFEQKYTLEISSDKQKLEFSNSDLIEQAKNGDYHIKVENSAGRIMEVYYIERKLYVSMDGKKFFLHADDLVEARSKKENVYSQANSFLKTYSHFITFIPDGEEERDGVRFLRFRTEIAKNPDKKEGERHLSLEEIKGYILLDKRSGGLVSVDIKGKIRYQREDKTALSAFSIKSSVRKQASPFSFNVPETGTEPQKLRIEKDLLQRLEKMEEKVDTEKEEDKEESE
ncbi:MAG: hypothetical protein N3B13_02395 [Deltaproteobacteria bacterium]|nr:hypothetical protein [Deltaproteobacteria bacterium]